VISVKEQDHVLHYRRSSSHSSRCLLARTPNVKYIFSHAGGTIPYLATRFSIIDEMNVILGAEERGTAADTLHVKVDGPNRTLMIAPSAIRTTATGAPNSPALPHRADEALPVALHTGPAAAAAPQFGEVGICGI